MAEMNLAASFIPALHKPAALLPIAKHHDSLMYLIETNPVTIVVGQTGSGKTTQIPQFLEQAGWCADGKIIAVTQVSELCIPVEPCPLLTRLSATARSCHDCGPQSRRGVRM